MTPIVKNTTRLVSGFIVVFGLHVGLSGHVGPGGGFAAGVIVAAAALLVVLAFGRDGAPKGLSVRACRLWASFGAAAFACVALGGYAGGRFFVNFLPAGGGHDLSSAGSVGLSDPAIVGNVAAGLAGVFLALAAFRVSRMGAES